MTQNALFLAGCALVVFARLVYDAWKRRRMQRALDALARQIQAWDEETGYPKECVAEGLGPRFVRRRPSPVVPIGTLDPSAVRALAEIVREQEA